jgi:hypothetical protein
MSAEKRVSHFVKLIIGLWLLCVIALMVFNAVATVLYRAGVILLLIGIFALWRAGSQWRSKL